MLRISPGAGLRACGHDANHGFEFSAVISGKVADQAMMVWELVVCESHSVVSDSLRPHGLCSPWNFPGHNTGVGNLFLLQGIFPAQGSNPSISYCRQILYQLSYQGSP